MKISSIISSFKKVSITLPLDRTLDNEFEIPDEVINKFNHIDLLVNNAALSLDNDFDLKTSDEFIDVLKVNLVGPFLLIQKLYKKIDNGVIINISSTDGINTYTNFNFVNRISNPQIIVIIRDENGNIKNENELGRIKKYIDNFQLDFKNVNKIYRLELYEKYNYRGLNFDFLSSNNQKMYVQLLINIDGETSLINNYIKIIIYAVIIGITLSAIASFILSQKTLQPVERILKNQTEFVQNASHELRTPLTIIQAKQELLLQEPNAKIIDKSEDIVLTLNETKRLSKLTKDLMILVRGSNFKLQNEDINIDEFIKNIILPYKDIAEAGGKQLILNLNFNKEICIDINKIHQLLIILLDNAIKYTEYGDKIYINTNLKENKCIIEVADTGIGISDEGINRIFERFYREDRARNRETGGSGLGLSIASMIVNAHNGTIKVSHNIPKGTIFTIKLNR